MFKKIYNIIKNKMATQSTEIVQSGEETTEKKKITGWEKGIVGVILLLLIGAASGPIFFNNTVKESGLNTVRAARDKANTQASIKAKDACIAEQKTALKAFVAFGLEEENFSKEVLDANYAKIQVDCEKSTFQLVLQ